MAPYRKLLPAVCAAVALSSAHGFVAPSSSRAPTCPRPPFGMVAAAAVAEDAAVTASDNIR